MFELSHYHLGDFEVVSIIHQEKNIGFEVIPGYGARLNSLKVASEMASGIEVIDGFTTEEELFNDTYYKSAFLFPFPNRLKDGEYSVNGSTYNFPINEKARNNAIHGFIADKPFEIDYVNTTPENAEIRLVYNNDVPVSYYPFTFKLCITYKIDTQSKFEVCIEVQNTSKDNLPFGFGWHPYFTFPDWTGVTLKISEVDQVELDERALPSGNVRSYTTLATFKEVDEVKLDDCFVLKCQNKNIAHLQNGVACLTIWRDVETIPYLQLYTPGKNCIAIEPMTCNVDALNNQMGMINLEPQSSYTTSFGVSIY